MSIGRTHGANALTEYDLRLLSTFANHIALAIENADLFERSRRIGAIEERSRVARDLHDTLIQSILGILRTLEAITPELLTAPPAVLQAIEDSRLFAKESLDEARRSIWNLTPAGLENRSLPEAIKEYVELWSRRTGIEATYQITGTPTRMAPTTAMDILHVAREALSNIAQHASASQADVTVDFIASALRLSIRDDGIGMNPEAVSAGQAEIMDAGDDEGEYSRHGYGAPRAGFGLGGMRERARLLNGWLQLESEPGRGTRIVLTIPDLNRPEAETVAPEGGEHSGDDLYQPSDAELLSGQRSARPSNRIADHYCACRRPPGTSKWTPAGTLKSRRISGHRHRLLRSRGPDAGTRTAPGYSTA
jgi:signal transduction histidine kinase